MKHARINRSFVGATMRSLVKEVARSMGVATGELEEVPDDPLHGITLRGSSASELTRLLELVDLRWRVNVGKLEVYAR